MNGSTRLSQHRPFNRGFLSAPAGAMRCALDEKPPPRGKEGGAAFAAYLKQLEKRRELTDNLAAYYQSGGYAMFDRHFLQWAADSGYSFDLLVNDDLHHRPEELSPLYKCAVFVGHDGEPQLCGC